MVEPASPAVASASRWSRDDRKLELSGDGAVKYVRNKDLLHMAHRAGLVRETVLREHIDPERGEATVVVEVEFGDGFVAQALGHASSANLKQGRRDMSSQYVHMAHTRARTRAYGIALNIDASTEAEMEGVHPDGAGRDGGANQPASRRAASPSSRPRASALIAEADYPPFNNLDGDGYECEQCGNAITDNGKWKAGELAAKSVQAKGQVLCYTCRFPQAA
ncbi:MAG: hypothetical protein IT340_20080 [Chloroflexi bacterium]|nr:hypothetical protein [Chloroflexota bacterium]